jgi:hypothetical protein
LLTAGERAVVERDVISKAELEAEGHAVGGAPHEVEAELLLEQDEIEYRARRRRL